MALRRLIRAANVLRMNRWIQSGQCEELIKCAKELLEDLREIDNEMDGAYAIVWCCFSGLLILDVQRAFGDGDGPVSAFE